MPSMMLAWFSASLIIASSSPTRFQIIRHLRQSRRIEDGIFHAEKMADFIFQFFVYGLCAANKTNGGHAIAVFIE